MKKIVVTGGSGFVATWVIAEFLNQDYAVATSLRSLDKAAAIKTGLRTCLESFQEYSQEG
ncbi:MULTISPECIES: hypothetical protein [Lactiplantibacillus]|uniref:hypothetical protein n=1 Tax=Lactiplantibacillus TaxID=2767842 RepID=UPI0021A59963|nr:hypothetical protein [Lactiplantibacillus plantarum]